MKKLFVLFLLLNLTLPVFCGELQNKYESKTYRENAVQSLVQEDYEVYLKHGDSLYGRVLKMLDNADETNDRFLKIIKNNFLNYRNDIANWKNIEIDDYYYGYLDEQTKRMIKFNNYVYKNRNNFVEKW